MQINMCRTASEALKLEDMSKVKMSQDEFDKECAALGLTITTACRALGLITFAFVDPRNVRKSLETNGFLSSPLTAAFRLLFMMVKRGYLELVDGEIQRTRQGES
tara:strand:- start:2237 stop:2551 length:315 start_codon:yes stop_codon:yes gene_type:complete